MSGKENNKRMPLIGFLHCGDLLAIELVIWLFSEENVLMNYSVFFFISSNMNLKTMTADWFQMTSLLVYQLGKWFWIFWYL